MNDYQFNPENVYDDPNQGAQQQGFNDQTDTHLTSTRFQDLVKQLEQGRLAHKFNFLDNKALPINRLYKSYMTMTKVRRTLQNYFPNKEDFTSFIGKSLNLQSNGKINEVLMKEGSLKKLIDDMFYRFQFNLTRYELESLFSVFDYNKKANINPQDISDVLYDENDKDFMMRVQKRPKGPPITYKREDLEEIVLDQEDQRLKRLMVDPTKQQDANLHNVLSKLDDRLFVDELNHFEKYNSFDIDKDGYVSTNDIKRKINSMNLLNPKELDLLVDYLDENQKGCVSFKDFNSKIKRNITNVDPFGKIIHTNIMQPNHEQIKRLRRDKMFYKGTVKAANDAVNPTLHTHLNTTSRYCSTPPWNNTFLNFQANKCSPQYIGEEDRLVANSQTRTSYQWDERTRRTGYDFARADKIRTHNNFFKTKIMDDENESNMKNDRKLQKKGAQQLLYEHVAHLKNAY